jgi:hypothetical protein
LIVAYYLAEDDPNDVFLLRHAFEQAEIYNPLVAVTGRATGD